MATATVWPVRIACPAKAVINLIQRLLGTIAVHGEKGFEQLRACLAIRRRHAVQS
jgi:hypothetical protein